MANLSKIERQLIEGKPALIVVDIQASTFIDASEMRAIDNMPGYKDRMLLACKAIDKARAAHWTKCCAPWKTTNTTNRQGKVLP